MYQESSQQTTVECYSGSRHPDRPKAFRWQGKRLEIDEVELQWCSQGAAYDSPTLYHYQVRTAAGRFHLVYDSEKDVWSIEHGEP